MGFNRSTLMLFTFLTIIPIMLTVAFYTLTERKLMAAMQSSKGPNTVGIWGLLQPMADGLKLFLKEFMIMTTANRFFFCFGPIWVMGMSLLNWALLPLNYYNSMMMEHNLLLVFVLSTLCVYGLMLSGWASSSRFGFMAAMRSVAQLISYEMFFSLTFLPCILIAGSMNLSNMVLKQRLTFFWKPLLPLAFFCFMAILAETNSAPFDLVEAEAELVAGPYTEYAATAFALFFLGEYATMLFFSGVFSVLFLGGWLPFLNTSLQMAGEIWFSIKTMLMSLLFVIVSANYPRMRYDQMMSYGWKIFMPFCFGYLLYCMGFLSTMEGLPLFFLPQHTLASVYCV